MSVKIDELEDQDMPADFRNVQKKGNKSARTHNMEVAVC